VEAARSVLHTAVEAQLGQSVREFSLQDRALAEALPDSSARRKAILRVLALKGTPREQLCAELANALGTLTTQRETFAHKLNERRAALRRVDRPSASAVAKTPAPPSEISLVCKPNSMRSAP